MTERRDQKPKSRKSKATDGGPQNRGTPIARKPTVTHIRRRKHIRKSAGKRACPALVTVSLILGSLGGLTVTWDAPRGTLASYVAGAVRGAT